MFVNSSSGEKSLYPKQDLSEIVALRRAMIYFVSLNPNDHRYLEALEKLEESYKTCLENLPEISRPSL